MLVFKVIKRIALNFKVISKDLELRHEQISSRFKICCCETN